MTTTRALAVAAYVAAVASPAAADWRSVADMLHAALPAVRGAVKPVDAPSGAAPRWFADWKLGKVYSLDSVAVTFADGVTVRCNLAKAPGKLPRIASACRVAVAFYRARTGNDSVPAFRSLVTLSDGAEFDAVACSDLTADLRRTAYVAPAVRPAVTAEAVERMEREVERRRAGLARTMAGDSAGLSGSNVDWAEAVAAGERELAAMRAGPVAAPVLSPLAVAAIEAMAPCEPTADVCEPAAVPCEPAAHIEPFAICPAVGMPCKVDCGFRAGCTPRPVEAIGMSVFATTSEGEKTDMTDPVEAIEAEPLAALCSDDDVTAEPGPVTVLCLSHKAREALLRRVGGRAVPDYGQRAKGGAFRLTVEDARACAGLKSVRFVGMPRKAYTRAAVVVCTPPEAIHLPTQCAPFLAALATSMRHGYAACYSASII